MATTAKIAATIHDMMTISGASDATAANIAEIVTTIINDNPKAPTTSSFTRTTGETVQITEWTIGAYTLRKAVDPDCTGWAVTNSDPRLPYIGCKDRDPHRPIFGVSVPASGELFADDALTLANQITEAANVAATFGMIAESN